MNKALLVIDVQKDYLGNKRDKERFCFENPEKLIQNINNTIAEYSEKGWYIIYIAEILPNLFLNRIIFGFSIRGTEGAKFVDNLNIVSDYYYEKQLGNSFTNKNLCRFIKDKKIDEIVLCGIDEASCVGATAKGGLKLSLNVSFIKNSIGTTNQEKAKSQRDKLKKRGVKYI